MVIASFNDMAHLLSKGTTPTQDHCIQMSKDFLNYTIITLMVQEHQFGFVGF